MVTSIIINRAPVLTLWAVIVAERLGFGENEALTLGKAVAGLNAQAKGQRLGVFHPREETPEQVRERGAGETYLIQLLGRPVPAINTGDGIRATIEGKPITPESVTRYLQGKFGEDLTAVRAAMEELAQAFEPHQLETKAYSLYEKFRPEIPEGKRGWGAQGKLNLDYIRSLALSE